MQTDKEPCKGLFCFYNAINNLKAKKKTMLCNRGTAELKYDVCEMFWQSALWYLLSLLMYQPADQPGH